MKLKSRLLIARAELALAFTALFGAMILEASLPSSAGLVGQFLNLALAAFIFAPLCVASWTRLGKVRKQLAELGPESAPSADLWTAPGAPGVIGVIVLLLALAAALAPPLLLR